MKELYNKYKEKCLSGKWIRLSDIEPLLNKHVYLFSIKKIGKSFFKAPIYEVNLGNGPIKILMWTQMHGNEATATKVVFDLLNVFSNQALPGDIKNILNCCTIKIIPMLNPDGAFVYTRANGQQIDLNRDAVNLKAPESQLLRSVLTEFNPDYCFNLHDQRNLYSVAKTGKPASISFLSPSTEVSRKLTPERLKAMLVINTMFEAIKRDLPHCVSRYNDEFYPNATGDNFQKDGYCTILIEAGHIQDDYDREKVRYFYFKALLKGLLSIANQSFSDINVYNSIPKNDTCYLDVIYNNVMLKDNEIFNNISVGVLFIEEIIQNKLERIPTIAKFGDLSYFGANTVKDANGIKINSINEFLSKIC